jgi:hypothetical protein
MVTEFVPRHGPFDARNACKGARDARWRTPMNTLSKIAEAVPALLLAAALLMPAFAVLA